MSGSVGRQWWQQFPNLLVVVLELLLAVCSVIVEATEGKVGAREGIQEVNVECDLKRGLAVSRASL